jgi:hypothetical protein
MTSPTQRPAGGRTFAVVVGAMIAVVAVVVLVVRAGAGRTSDEPAGPPITTIDIVSEPAGASVVRADDGGVVGVTPLTASFPKKDGELPVIVTLEGYQTRRVMVPLFSVTGRIDVMMTKVGEDAAVPPPLPEHWNP